MKRLFLILGLILVVGIGTAFVYADRPVSDELPNPQSRDFDIDENVEWHHNRIECRKDELNRALEEGRISKEEAKTWEEHFDYMDEFHKENGFMRSTFGGCHGRRRFGIRRRHGRGF